MAALSAKADRSTTALAVAVPTTSDRETFVFASSIFRIAPASARTFSGETGRTTSVTASSSLSMSQPREERGIPSVEGRHQQGSVEVTVAPLAGGLGDQAARMAGRSVE